MAVLITITTVRVTTKRHLERLQDKSAHETLTKAHEDLMQAIGRRLQEGLTSSPQSLSGSSSSSSSTSLPGSQVFIIPKRYRDLTRQNAASQFPNVKFWYQTDYAKHTKDQKRDSNLLRRLFARSHPSIKNRPTVLGLAR
ncbi:hypothetical protein BDZ97DRAFT_1762696 [Flammula alnicola]|nr:hypothetical protein BDZ97DRAFT_1762696 [Flammula alnicola]